MSMKLAQVYAELTVKGGSRVASELNQIKGRVFNLKNALVSLTAGYGLTRLSRSFIDVASEVEQFHLTLRTVIQDSEDADKAFDWVREFARTTPFNTDEVVRSFTLLKSVGIANAEETMQVIGDAAMVFGRDIEDTTSALISMETEVWRRFGVEIDRTGEQWKVQLNGQVIETEKDINKLRDAVVTLLKDNFQGGMEAATNTWKGSMMTMNSLWWEFRADLMGDAGEGGPFDAVRGAIIQVKDKWSEWVTSDDYKTFIADAQSGLVNLFASTLEGLAGVISTMEGLYQWVKANPYISQIGVLGYVLGGRTLAVAGIIAGTGAQVGKTLAEYDNMVIELGKEREQAQKDLAVATAAGDVEGMQRALAKIDSLTQRAQKIMDRGIGSVHDGVGSIGEGADTTGSTLTALAEKIREFAQDLRNNLGTAVDSVNSKLSAKPAVPDDSSAPPRPSGGGSTAGSTKITLDSVAQASANYYQAMADAWRSDQEDFLDSIPEYLSDDWYAAQEAARSYGAQLGNVADKTSDVATKSDLWANDLAQGLAQAIVNGEDLGDVLTNIGKQLASSALQKLIFGAFGGEGGLFDGLHSGGIVGDEATFRRQIRIPRMHSGGIVGDDEQLAILRKGEGVFTEGQMAAMGSQQMEVKVNVVNNTGVQAEPRQETRFDGQRWVVDVWLDALANNTGQLRTVLQGVR